MLNAKSLEPIPRMYALSTEEEPENAEPASSVTFGVRLESEATSPTARSCRASAVKAEMAIGTCCTFSERFCAVTTISSSMAWAPASVAPSNEQATAVNKKLRACEVKISITPSLFLPIKVPARDLDSQCLRPYIQTAWVAVPATAYQVINKPQMIAPGR